MKVLVNSLTDTIISVIQEDFEDFSEFFKNCYVINVNSIADKFLHKGIWTGKDYEVIDKKKKTSFLTNPNLWSVNEILLEKYDRMKSTLNYANVLFQEFIAFDKIVYEGNLNFGKKFCQGVGVLHHDLEHEINQVTIVSEFDGELSISIDGNCWELVSLVPFSFEKLSNKIYLKLNNAILNSYALFFN